jgi:hypothetical protein
MKALKLLAVIYIAVCVCSCNTAYKTARQEKKDNKLFAAVISNKIVSDQLDNYFSLQHPIGKPVLIQGKDSIIYTPVYIDRVKDSLIKVACPEIDLDSLRKAGTVNIYHVRIDTFKIPDTTSIRQLQLIQKSNANLQGKYEQQNIQLIAEKKRSNKWLWFFIGACVFIVVENGLIIYMKVK